MQCTAMTLRKNERCLNDARPNELYCLMHLWMQGRKAEIIIIATIATTLISTAFGIYSEITGGTTLDRIWGTLDAMFRGDIIELHSFDAESPYREDLARKARSQFQFLRSDFFDKFSKVGKNFFLLQEYEEAESCYAIAGTVDASGYLSDFRLGKVAFELGRFKEATERFRKPLEIMWGRRGTFSQREQLAFTEATPYASYSYRQLGQYDDARIWAKRGAATASQAGLIAQEGFNLNALGLIFLTQTELGEALAQFDRCLKVAATSAPDARRSCLANRAVVYKRLGRLKEAEEDYLGLLGDTNLRRSERAENLNNLGSLYVTMKECERAVPCFRESLSFKRQIKDAVGICNTLNNLCSVLTSCGKLNLAEAPCKDALSSCAEVDNPDRLIKPHDNYGYFLEKSGRFNEAYDHYKKAAKHLAGIPGESIDPRLAKQVKDDVERVQGLIHKD